MHTAHCLCLPRRRRPRRALRMRGASTEPLHPFLSPRFLHCSPLPRWLPNLPWLHCKPPQPLRELSHWDACGVCGAGHAATQSWAGHLPAAAMWDERTGVPRHAVAAPAAHRNAHCACWLAAIHRLRCPSRDQAVDRAAEAARPASRSGKGRSGRSGGRSGPRSMPRYRLRPHGGHLKNYRKCRRKGAAQHAWQVWVTHGPPPRRHRPSFSPGTDRQQQKNTMQAAQLSSVSRVAARPTVVRQGLEPCSPGRD